MVLCTMCTALRGTLKDVDLDEKTSVVLWGFVGVGRNPTEGCL